MIRGGARDRGSSSAELVVVTPVLVLLVMVFIQFALWALAARAVESAAAEGGAEMQTLGASAAAAVQLAKARLAALSGPLVRDVTVEASSTSGGLAVLSVRGLVTSLIPVIHIRVAATSASLEQRFRGSG